jgi:hypothetical protein
MKRSGHDRGLAPVTARPASTGGLERSQGAREGVAAQTHASLNLGRLPARNSKPVEGTGNDMKLRRYPEADEAPSIFQIFLEKQIERTDGYERGWQPG